MITKPLLAGSYDATIHASKFPFLATPKIDGIRFVRVGNQALTRSMKEIPNCHIFELLVANLPEGVDGEITVGGTFQQTTSAVMSKKGEPTFKVWIFDYAPTKLFDDPYLVRLLDLNLNYNFESMPFDVEVLAPTVLNNVEELHHFESKCLADNYEGVMLRKDLKYKCGRSTAKEMILLKKKIFSDSEATIVGFCEEMQNNNEAFTNELGSHESTRY